ncbi:MAG: MFS transporter [bacterium]|nr:MFS transporter [bacterium]
MKARGRLGPVVAVLCLCSLTSAMALALMVPLFPDLPKLLGTSTEDASWLVTVTIVSAAVATPSLTRLADMFGKRRMAAVALASMFAGSLLAIVGQSLGVLIAARALHGCALAIVPISISIMRDELPRARLNSGVALISAMQAVGAALALTTTGIIYQVWGWHAVFAVTALEAIVLLVALFLVVPESPVRTGGRFDFVGTSLLSALLVAGMLAITKGGHWGWTSRATLGAGLLTVLLLILFIRSQRRATTPLIDLASTTNRAVVAIDIVAFLAGFALYSNLLSASNFLQAPEATGYGHGLSALQVGVLLVPGAVAGFFLAPVSARISSRFGARATLTIGCSVYVLGYTYRIFAVETVWQVSVGAAVVACAGMLVLSSSPLVIMGSVPISQTASANGLNNVMRYIGMATASAAIAAILTTAFTGADGEASLTGYRVLFVLAIAATIAALIIVRTVPRGLGRRTVAVVDQGIIA